MAWFSGIYNSRPVRRFAAFYLSGVRDAYAFLRYGKRHSFETCVASRLDQCRPFTDHVDKAYLEEAENYVNMGNFNAAQDMIHEGRTDEASDYCIELLEGVIKLCQLGAPFEIDDMYEY